MLTAHQPESRSFVAGLCKENTCVFVLRGASGSALLGNDTDCWLEGFTFKCSSGKMRRWWETSFMFSEFSWKNEWSFPQLQNKTLSNNWSGSVKGFKPLQILPSTAAASFLYPLQNEMTHLILPTPHLLPSDRLTQAVNNRLVASLMSTSMAWIPLMYDATLLQMRNRPFKQLNAEPFGVGKMHSQKKASIPQFTAVLPLLKKVWNAKWARILPRWIKDTWELWPCFC